MLLFQSCTFAEEGQCGHLEAGQEHDHGSIIAGTHHAVDWAIQVVGAPLVSYLRVASHGH